MISIDFVSTSKPSGSKTYIINFCKELFNKKTFDKEITIFIVKSYLDELNVEKKPENIKIVTKSNLYSNSILRLIWCQIILPIKLISNRSKVLFSPLNIAPIIVKFLKIKNILTLHSNLPWVYFNMMPSNFLKKYLIKFFMTLSIKNCDCLIVNSDYAKQEIISKLNVEEKKIIKIYLGINIDDKKKFYNHSSNENEYILSVLSCVRYHNVINLLKGYELFINKYQKKINLKLIMQILDYDYFKEIKQFIKINELDKKIEIITAKERSLLNDIYLNANSYVFTSYCEVFGYSTLEAMNFGLPVLTSDRSALKEINGDAAIYFNPDNIEEISDKLFEISSNEILRNNLRIRGIENLKRFKNLNNFNETMDLIFKFSDK